MVENGIYVTNGPGWERDKAIILAEGPEYLKEGIPTMEGLESIPIQDTAAYAQASLSGRFQEYTETWFEDGENSRTKLIDYGLVKETKVAMFAGLFDDTCPLPFAYD